MTNEDYSQSFLPLIGTTPKILILGTMPGIESLKQHQYYAHPRNIFWKIIFEIFKGEFSIDYQQRTTFALKNELSLWDVCSSCFRKGSLDSDIKSEIPNKIHQLIEQNASFSTIIFNGQKAEKLYKKHFEQLPNKKYFTALSTSPANASYTFEQKLENWKTGLLS